MRPYDESRLPSYEWIYANVAAVEIDPRGLLPSQPDLDLSRVLHFANGGPPEGPDECLHVVEFGGRYYVHDGHHRWVVAYSRGKKVSARLVSAENAMAETGRAAHLTDL
jgi:hypothetical protein